MEIGSIKDILPTCIHPHFFGNSLAHGTATIAAGIIMNLYGTTILTYTFPAGTSWHSWLCNTPQAWVLYKCQVKNVHFWSFNNAQVYYSSSALIYSFNRYDLPVIFTTCAWWRPRSRIAFAITGSKKRLSQSLKFIFGVRMVLFFSYLLSISWKNSFESSLSKCR